MRALFSDRLWVLKLALAAACFSWLCRQARSEISQVEPSEEAVPVRPDWIGRRHLLSVCAVLAERPDGYEIETDAGPALLVVPRVEGVKPGDLVSAYATIEGPRRFRAPALQVNRGYVWKRALNYALSVAVILVLLWSWRDRLRLRLSEGLFRART